MADEDPDFISRRADSLVQDHSRLLSELVATRKRHGLSQAVVAERVGVSQPTVAGFERYDANPTLSTLRRYALAVGARLETRVVDDCVDAQAFEAVVGGQTFASPTPVVDRAFVVTTWNPTPDRLRLDV